MKCLLESQPDFSLCISKKSKVFTKGAVESGGIQENDFCLIGVRLIGLCIQHFHTFC